MPQLVSLLGLFVMVGLAWLLSAHRTKVSWRVVAGGLLLQFAFATLTLKTAWGHELFNSLGDGINALMAFSEQGSEFIFGINPRAGDEGLPPRPTIFRTVAFGVLPTIIFFSSLMSVLYHVGVMQWVVRIMAVIMQRTLGTSGAESLSAASNIFVGQTEAPLLIKPFLATMTLSEIMAVMVGGFATVAGGVMAAYISFGVDAKHLLTASVISAPAALLIAKIMQPEVDQPQTLGKVEMTAETGATNLIEAAAIGAADGLKLALNVAAMLIAFIALVAMCDALLVKFSGLLGQQWNLKMLFGYAFAPFAWLIGVESQDCLEVGKLLGTRTAINEFVAYIDLGEVSRAGTISERSKTLATYALCGFANFSSIGIQIGGIGALAPERQADLARLGLRAMIGGTLACFMTACVAGMLI
jgi:CNT family concentrative nucleoside transporter